MEDRGSLRRKRYESPSASCSRGKIAFELNHYLGLIICRNRRTRSSHVQLESVIGNDDMRGCGAELFTQPLIATTKGATGGFEIEEIEVMVGTARGAVFIPWRYQARGSGN